VRRSSSSTAAASSASPVNRDVSRILPPADLLSRVQGVEPVLQRGRTFQKFGLGAFLVSAVSLLGSILSSPWWKDVTNAHWVRTGVHQWLLVAAAASFVVAVLLVGWLRIWVRASRTPFRYTYSIEAFTPVEGAAEEPRLAWLRHDLSTRLSRRIRRLSLLDEQYSKTTEAPDSHIHIGGVYGIRTRSNGECVIEVMPWVRLGPTGAPASLAHPVRFTLTGGARELQSSSGPPSYEKLVERVYFSVASRIYRRIRDDVQHKIDLLPRRYFRAAAYFYEAEDYIRSNTLDAYQQAQELYAEVIKLYTPSWRDEDVSRRAGRFLRFFDGLHARWSLYWRRLVAFLWPALGSREVMVARAELGFARTLVYRRAVAGLSGQRRTPIFQARPVAARAVERLERLRADVPDRRKRLFDARVTQAAVYAALGSFDDADERLREARAGDPARAEANATFMYVQGQVSTRQRGYYFQRAGELLPTFEVAQYERAIETELLWRRRQLRETNVADIVVSEYERVLELNPGNVSAWANLGYVYWLLDDSKRARRALERGREYKEIRQDTSVADLDSCLARLAAERGDFKRAYAHYVDAVAGRLSQGVWYAPDRYTAYPFEAISRWMIERFKSYRRAVRRLQHEAAHSAGGPRDGLTGRVRDAVYAFVLNDYGEACFNYWIRSGDDRYHRLAEMAFDKALRSSAGAPGSRADGVRPQTRNPVVAFNLNRLRWWQLDALETSQYDWTRPQDVDRALEVATRLLEFRPRKTHIDDALVYEPSWADGLLEKTWSDMTIARQSRDFARLLDEAAEVCRKREKELEGAARTVQKDPNTLGAADDPREGELRRAFTGSAATSAATAGLTVTAQQREEAKALGDRVEVLEGTVKKLRDAADEFHAEARSAPERLIPHAWMRRRGAVDLLFARRRRHRSLWERELDDTHVWALFALCSVDLSSLDRTTGLRARITRWRVARMLTLIQSRFWSDEVPILIACLRASAWESTRADAYLLRIQQCIRRSCERDPSYQSFRYLVYVNSLIDRARIFRAVGAVCDKLQTRLSRRLPHQLRRAAIWYRLRTSGPFERVADVCKRLGAFEPARGGIFGYLGEEMARASRVPGPPRLDEIEPGRPWLPPAAGRLAPYDDLLSSLEDNGVEELEQLARELSRASTMYEDYTNPAADEQSLYVRVARFLRDHGAPREAELARAIAKDDTVLQTMTGDRGVPRALYGSLGDELRARGQLDVAATAYSLGRRALDNRRVEFPIAVGLAQLDWQRGDFVRAAEQFRMLDRYPPARSGGWRTALVGSLIDSVPRDHPLSPGGYRSLKNWLGRDLTVAHERAMHPATGESDEAEAAAVDAAEAVLRASRRWYLSVVHRPETADVEKEVRPVAPAILEVQSSFFYAGETLRDFVNPLLDEDIAKMQRATADTVGLVLPSFLLHASDHLPPGRYRLHVDGVPVADGEYDSSPGREQAEARRMLEHLRDEVLAHPDGLPLSSQAIEIYEKKARARGLAQHESLRFAGVLRALVRERVAVDVSKVADTVVAFRRLGLRELVEEARLAVREGLPGADCSCPLVSLPPDVETHVAALLRPCEDSQILSASAEDLMRIGRELDAALAGVVPGSALVVLTPGLRSFVHALVGVLRPDLPVLAYVELPDGSMPLVDTLVPAGAG
jgi:tetratricopeptide (TPR) repeat protein/voltage-gated potassium channel Kch